MMCLPPTCPMARELHSTNALISNWRVLGYLYDGAEGIKTGSTDEAGYCLVSTAVRGGRRLIAVGAGLRNKNHWRREEDHELCGFRHAVRLGI